MANVPADCVIIEGDIERRVISVYTPDFYKDNPVFGTVTDLLRSSVATLDYMLEKARGLRTLTDLDDCPPEFLQHLGALLSYTWDPSLSVEGQREEIRKLVAVYQIRGTPASSIRIVLNAGARTADVLTPFESIAFADVSYWDRGARVEDEKFWRWGTYEVISDIDFSRIYTRLADVHPAGTVWYGRQLVNSSPDEAVDPDEEAVQETSVIHVVGDDYRTASAENYPEEVLNDLPDGYWRLDDSSAFEVASGSSGSTYGDAEYGASGYGGGGGLFARDSSGNERHGQYAYEKDVVAYGDGVSTTWPTAQLPHPPVVPGQLKVTVETQVLHDDGSGNLTGDGSGEVDYTTGKLTNLKFNAAPGLGPEDLPVISGEDTLSVVGGLELLIDVSALPGTHAARFTTPFNELSPHARLITPLVAGNEPYWFSGPPSFLLFNNSSEDSVLRLSADLNLGTTHTICVSAFMATDSDCVFIGDSVNNCRFWYNDTTKKIGYRTNGGSDVFSETFNFGDLGVNVLTVQRSGAAVSFFVNGTPIGAATLSGGDSSTPFTCRNICGLTGSAPVTVPLDGALYGVAAYSTVHSPTERLSVELFLGRKSRVNYGIWAHYKAEDFIGLEDGSRINRWNDSSGSLLQMPNAYDRDMLVGARAPLDPNPDAFPTVFNNANSLALPDGEQVGTWADLFTGLDTNNWVQSTPAKKPTFVGNAQNGHPSIKFDGTKVMGQSAQIGVGRAHQIVFSIKFNALGLTPQVLLSDATGNFFISYDPVTKKITYQCGVGVVATSDAFDGFEVGRWYTLAIYRLLGGATIEYWVDNVKVGASKTVTPDTALMFLQYLGGLTSTPTSGFIGELGHLYAHNDVGADVHRWYMDSFSQEMGIQSASTAVLLRTATPTGLPAVRSVGNSTDGAHMSQYTNSFNTQLYGIGHTFAFVFRIHSNTNGAGTGAHRFATCCYYNLPGKTLVLETLGGNTWSWVVNIPTQKWHVLVFVRNRSNVEAFLNGVSLGVKTNALAETETFLIDSLFDKNYADSGAIDFADVLLSDVAQDANTTALLMSHYATKHGIPTSSSTSAVPIEAIYNDYVGRGYPGVLRTSNTFCARFGYDALVNRDVITLPVDDALAPRKHSWSAEFWVKSSLGLGGTIIGAYWGTYPNIYRVNIRLDAVAGGMLSWEIQDGTGGAAYTLASNTSVNDDEWHHVVAVINVDHQKLEFYVDGLLDSSKVVPILGVVDFNPGAESFTVGGLSTDAPDRDFFQGDLDEIAIYATRLPVLSIQLHYAMGSGFNWTDESQTTMLISNVEPIGSFGVRSFLVDQSVLDGTSQLDTADIYDVVTGETVRWVKNPGGAADRVSIVDFVNVNVVQAFERVKIGEALKIGIPVKDSIGVSDSVSATPEEGD